MVTAALHNHTITYSSLSDVMPLFGNHHLVERLLLVQYKCVYMYVCVCVYVRVSVCAYVCLCVRVCVCVRENFTLHMVRSGSVHSTRIILIFEN